jgi:acyl carrier protein
MDMKLRSHLRKYVKQRLGMHADLAPLGDDDPLFTSGRLDSLDAIEFIVMLEERYGVNFSKVGFDLTLMDSIVAMADLVERYTVDA